MAAEKITPKFVADLLRQPSTEAQAAFLQTAGLLNADGLNEVLDFAGDLDGDGDLDAFVGSDKVGQIWFNDGGGNFKAASQKFRYSRYHAVTLGDVDGNSTIDIIAGRLDTVIVWYNDGMGRMRNRK